MKQTSKQLLNITFIALFAALSYISLAVFFIPFANMYIHFGNLIVVLAALLIGGWQGGLAGSIGMGLYDVLGGYIDSAPKTFVLKFLIGLTVGIVYTLIKRVIKNKTLAATIAAVSGMVVNIIGETVWKTVFYFLAGSDFKAAFITAVLGQSSTLVNAVIAVVGGVTLYCILEKPFSKMLNK